jgi:23S rRNA pseudouridine2605 synthase
MSQPSTPVSPGTAPLPAVRLNKYLAQAGVASRRGADELIRQGRVQVNGRPVSTLGTLVTPGRDRVTLDGVVIELQRETTITLMVNKPAGYLCTRHDPEGRPTVYDLLPAEYHRLHPIGRLDLDSEGLVLLTDDGDLTYRLTHPSFAHDKEYWVQVSGRVPAPAWRKLRQGVMLEDGPAVATVRPLASIPAEQRFWVEPEPDPRHSWLVFVIHEGRKRQIRRMCEAVGLEVRRLIRVRMASLHIGDLAPGHWRRLTARQQRAVAAIKGG